MSFAMSRTRVSRASRIVERDGTALTLLALVLLGDEHRAETEVAKVITAATGVRRWSTHHHPTRKQMSASLVRRCGTDQVGDPESGRAASRLGGRTDALLDLPACVRESLALCVYGGQSYIEAARLLNRPSDEVAQELLSGLRSMQDRPHQPGSAVVEGIPGTRR